MYSLNTMAYKWATIKSEKIKLRTHHYISVASAHEIMNRVHIKKKIKHGY